MLSNGSRSLVVLSLIVSGSCLTGCSFNPKSLGVELLATKTPIGNLHGTAFGGRQAITGAHIYLYEAGTSGYGTASTSILQSASNTTQDGSGNYYTLTDSDGYFSVGGDYTCTVGTQVYLYAIGGNPGAGTNTGAGLLAALGQCPSAGNLAQTVPQLNVDEVSTIAMAYAVSGYAVDPTHIASSGTALAQTGIANAFATVPNLINVAYGQALSTTPAGNGTVPTSRLNAFANVLAACVNSTGATSPQCSTLFADATLDGTGTGTKPTDTAAAAINMAHHPGTNVAAIFNLQQSIGAPFAPAITVATADLTLAVSYTGGGMSANPHLAIDGSGNVWSAPDSSTIVAKLSPIGAALSGSSGFTGTGLLGAKDIAIDATGNAVVLGSKSTTVLLVTTYYGIYTQIPNSGSGGSSSSFVAHPLNVGIGLDASGNMAFVDSTLGDLLVVNSSGGTVGTMLLGGLTAGTNFAAFDGSGNLWSTNGNNSLSKFTGAGVAISLSGGYTGGGLNAPNSLALDSGGNAWVANASGNSITKLNPSGAAISGSSGFTGGGLNKPVALAIDGLGKVWVANATGNSVSELSSTGAAITGTSAFTDSSLNKPSSIAVDGSGNVWVGNTNSAALTEFIGAAAPVVTPIAYAMKNNIIATRP